MDNQNMKSNWISTRYYIGIANCFT